MKRAYFVLIAVMLLAVFAVSSAFAQEGSGSFNNGMQLYYEKKFKESQDDFLRALDKDPLDTMALSFYLDAGYRSNDLIKSVNLLEQKAMEDEKSAVYKAQLGLGYFTRGLIDQNMLNEANTQLKEALQMNPDLSIANTGMGMIYYHKRLIPRAKGYFIKALKSNPNDLMALERLGEIMMVDDKNPQAALEIFNKMMKLAPNYSDAYFYAASANEKLGNKDEAINLFVKCMELDKNGILKGYDSPLRLGDMYINDSKWEDAEKYYKMALVINPENPYAKTMIEKAKTKGKNWKGNKVNNLKGKLPTE